MLIVGAAALAGCRVEGGDGAAVGAGRAETPRTPGAAHGVFHRERVEVAPGVARVTLSAVVRGDLGRDSARALMERLAESEREADTAVAAIRVLAYLPPAPGHGERRSPLVPLAFLDWAPAPGWDSLSAATVGRPYATVATFVHDEATLRAMGAMGGMPRAAPGPLPPGATMPPGHPAPGRPR